MSFFAHRGFTLMEVLISLLLLSFLLLGFDGLQLYSFRQTRQAYAFSVAANQIQNMQERLRALRQGEGLAEQVRIWNRENALSLPAGEGNVSGNYPEYRIEIFWGGEKHPCEKIHSGASGCLVEDVVL